jgi:hypothetical protein
MNFAKALKYTDAPARIARLMAALAVVCRKTADETGVLAIQARTFWLLSITSLAAPHHVSKRIDETVSLFDYATDTAGFGSQRVLDLARDTRDQLLAIVDELQAAMAMPSTVKRRPDDTDTGRRPMPTGPRTSGER